jgi:hypothetical protein
MLIKIRLRKKSRSTAGGRKPETQVSKTISEDEKLRFFSSSDLVLPHSRTKTDLSRFTDSGREAAGESSNT